MRVLQTLVRKRDRIHPSNRRPDLRIMVKMSLGDLEEIISALERKADGRGGE